MKKENKNIERLFQEKFKDFEVSPPDFVWENIQEKLQPKEKKRRVIPFWFKTAGIAASFVAILSVVFYNMGNDFKNTNTNNNSNSVVNSETTKDNYKGNQNIERTNATNTSESNSNQNISSSSFSNEGANTSKSNSLVNTNSTDKVSGSSQANSKLNKRATQNSNTYQSNNSFVSNQKNKQNTSLKKSKIEFKSSSSGMVSNKGTRNKYNSSIKSNAPFNDFDSSKKNTSNFGITDLNSVNKFNLNKKVNSTNSGITDLANSNKQNNSINSGITNINSIKNNSTNSGLTDINNSNSSNTISKSIEEINGVLVETSIENSNTTSTAIVAVEEIRMDTITLATVTIEENLMEKLLREKEIKKVADEKEKRSKWAVNSYVSPIFFNSFSNGSPLSEEFANNEKTFNNSTSYGIGIAYNLNKRLSIKTGVSNLNLDFDTENIAFYSTYEDQSKIANTNIERNANSKYLAIKHEKEVSKNAVENQIIQTSQNSGNLNQKTQYIEVPLELSYALLNKKFGVAIKGGMSTLFLTENEVSIKAPDGNMQIGKASNLNNVHFSSNVGLGLSYLFMKNFQLNVEPTLKYQINTFNKNSEDFTPYVIGVNTGISYKF
jgi:hypothetical protein